MYLRTYLVEDNPTIRENLVATLKELAQVETVGMADTELEAESWLTANPDAWDLVIIDLFLRQGSGMGVLEACAPLAGDHHLVVLSNYATADIRARCLGRSGAGAEAAGRGAGGACRRAGGRGFPAARGCGTRQA